MALREPGWRECLVVAVRKGSDVAQLITDDAEYGPKIR
jgi:hypothetical protein